METMNDISDKENDNNMMDKEICMQSKRNKVMNDDIGNESDIFEHTIVLNTYHYIRSSFRYG